MNRKRNLNCGALFIKNNFRNDVIIFSIEKHYPVLIPPLSFVYLKGYSKYDYRVFVHL